MDLLNALFSESITDMDTEALTKWLQTVETVDEIGRAVSDFNEEVFKNLTRRHDVPADIRIVLAKYSVITTELSEMLLLATSDDSYLIMDRKEDA
ncbi:MAG TPA: hypothetical protein PLN56_09370 [Methanoregulaceae archaeon]|jgi:hypothetical protein|nr:hypothetical protein [Methanoregulaceae archaeon]